MLGVFFFSSRRRHTRLVSDWSSDVCSSDLVDFEGMLLKPNMVLPGYDAAEQVSDDEIARATIKCFKRTVPAAVPGIVFLSGGQSDEDATARLNAMNALAEKLPWQLSFS